MNCPSEVEVQGQDHRFIYAKDHSNCHKPGKYAERPKAERPKDKFAAIKARRCSKLRITEIDIAKRIIASARWSRSKAEAEGSISKRRENRWYICENCSSGKAKIYHVTTLSQEKYADKFESSLRWGYDNVA
jgi:hypothetical protein